MINDPPIGAEFWPAGPVGPAAGGRQIGDFPCGIDHANIGYHVHTQVSIYLNGQQLRVPSNVGIGGPSAPAPFCMYALHTHDATGVVHVENLTSRQFTLGEFFALWGQPLSPTNVAGITGLPVVAWVLDRTGNTWTITQHTGELSAIRMEPRRNVVIQIGSALSQVQTYRYGNE